MRRCAAYPRPRTKFFRKQVSETAAGIKQQSDFSKGSVSANILSLALPLTVAQLINVLYNVVDRIYIGHIPGASSAALTGVGVTFPILSIVIAFANLFGTGGAPLFSIARGRGDDAHAADIMGNTFTMLLGTGLVLTALVLAFKKPLLYLFGASDATFPYADGYLTIYLCGTVFVMLGLGMNNFINAQGFGSMGMITVLLGAVVNIILDPVFIFALGMGVQGAALATVISQFLSALWAVAFLCGKRAPPACRRAPRSAAAPASVFHARALEAGGRDLRPGPFGLHHVRHQQRGAGGVQRHAAALGRRCLCGCDDGTQLGAGDYHNARHGHYQCRAARHRLHFGAGEYKRVRSGIQFMSAVCVGYTAAVWLCLFLFPQAFIRLFTSDPALLAAGVPSMHVYFFGFFMMALQFAGQSTNTALGRARQAVFFSLLRKAVIVIPLTLWLPGRFGLGVNGVFLAEPISNFLGGGACFVTMLLTVWPDLKRRERLHASGARG